MPKNYTASKVDRIELRYKLKAHNLDTNLHHAARMQINGYACNGNIIVPICGTTVWLGTGQSTPWTDAQLWQAINNYSDMNTVAAEHIKQLVIDGINEDPST
jgi:hypothetical protein